MNVFCERRNPLCPETGATGNFQYFFVSKNSFKNMTGFLNIMLALGLVIDLFVFFSPFFIIFYQIAIHVQSLICNLQSVICNLIKYNQIIKSATSVWFQNFLQQPSVRQSKA